MTFAFADRRHEQTALDIIGDVHGCHDELAGLLAALGYRIEGPALAIPPTGRRAVFVGDFVDRGPASPAVLRLVMGMVAAGHALAVPGNHDVKFARWLEGRKVTLSHGLDLTIAQMRNEPKTFHNETRTFLESLPTYLWLDGGRLVVAHGGIEEAMIGGIDGKTRSFCIYGDTDGKVDAEGHVIRYDWASKYSGGAHVVYGHVPVPEPAAVNNTLCIDTACCYGGRLTAYRWPERQVIDVPALKSYATRGKPLGLPPPRA